MLRAIPMLGGIFVLAAAAAAAPVLSVDGMPAQYTPGESFSFDVLLTDAENLASYNVAVLMTLESGTLGSDAWFEIPSAPASRYVFTDDTNFWADDALGAELKLAVSDFHDPNFDGLLEGVTTVAGVNDRIATVTIATAASLTGSVYISLGADDLELDTPDLDTNSDPVPISGAESVRSAIAAEQPREIEMIPEPLTALLLLGGAPILLRRRASAWWSR